MVQRTDRIYPSAPLENSDLEQRLEMKINDLKSFNNYINNIEEIVTYCKDKSLKSKYKHKKYNNLRVV